jgi:hypothetical protein
VALDLDRGRAAADEAGEGVFGAPLPIGRLLVERVGALARELAPGIVKVAMPMAPITSPGVAPASPSRSSRSGMRLTTKVPALLVSRSIRIGSPVSSTRRIWVFGITSSTRWPRNWSIDEKPSAGRKRR